jgi:hypothetical protein
MGSGLDEDYRNMEKECISIAEQTTENTFFLFFFP